MASRLRDRFARGLGPEYARFLEILGRLRPEVASRIPDFETRKQLWLDIVDSEALPRLRAGDEPAARSLIDSILQEREAHAAR